MSPTIGQLKAIAAYGFVVTVGVYVGGRLLGFPGMVIGAVMAVPVAIVLGILGLAFLASLLGYDTRKTNKEESA